VIHLLVFALAVRHNSFYLAVLNIVMLALVTGQGLFLEVSPGYEGTLSILSYTITEAGRARAWAVWFGILFGFVAFALVFYENHDSSRLPTVRRAYPAVRVAESRVFTFRWTARASLRTLIIAVPVTLYLLRVVGGPEKLIFGIRPTDVTGATLPLLVLLGTKYVGIYSVAKWGRLPILPALTVVVFTGLYFLSGTRVVAALYAAGMAFALAYGTRLRLRYRHLILLAMLAFVGLVVTQSIKVLLADELAFSAALGETMETFYVVQVEGFTGLAGFLSSVRQGSLNADFGISLLQVPIRFVPGQFRGSLSVVEEFVASAYPYDGSIVPPGPQVFLAHFGWLGPLLLTAALAMGCFVEKRLRTRLLTPAGLASGAIVMAHSLLLIRGALLHYLFYLVADIVFTVLFFRFVIEVKGEARTIPDGNPLARGL